MSAGFVMTAGRAGGDFDALIDYMGQPIAFGYDSHGPKQVTMVEGRGTTGQSIDILRMAGGVTQEVVLRDAGGKALLDIKVLPIAFGLEQPASQADGVLDSMMNLVQSSSVGGLLRAYSFVGNIGNDSFTGHGADDTLTGGGGQDQLFGGGGSDVVAGGRGDDKLGGGSGADLLRGGSGADVFVFNGTAALASGDTIADYSHAEGDAVDLRAVDAVAGNATVDHFTPITTAFTGTKGELRIEHGAKGATVLGDANGDGVADFTLTLLGVGETETISFYME